MEVEGRYYVFMEAMTEKTCEMNMTQRGKGWLKKDNEGVVGVGLF